MLAACRGPSAGWRDTTPLRSRSSSQPAVVRRCPGCRCFTLPTRTSRSSSPRSGHPPAGASSRRAASSASRSLATAGSTTSTSSPTAEEGAWVRRCCHASSRGRPRGSTCGPSRGTRRHWPSTRTAGSRWSSARTGRRTRRGSPTCGCGMRRSSSASGWQASPMRRHWQRCTSAAGGPPTPASSTRPISPASTSRTGRGSGVTGSLAVEPGAVTYVATLGTDVVGFASVGPVRDEDLARQQECWTEVYGLYVDPDRWGAGVGTALWGAVEAGWAEETAAVALWVLRDNVRAREFYAGPGAGSRWGRAPDQHRDAGADRGENGHPGVMTGHDFPDISLRNRSSSRDTPLSLNEKNHASHEKLATRRCSSSPSVTSAPTLTRHHPGCFPL